MNDIYRFRDMSYVHDEKVKHKRTCRKVSVAHAQIEVHTIYFVCRNNNMVTKHHWESSLGKLVMKIESDGLRA